MTIPDFQSCMLPVLKVCRGRDNHKRQEIISTVIESFELSEEERRKVLPSGTATVIRNRVGWAITYLKQAGLLFSPARGTYRMTDRGEAVLSTNPGKVDLKTLQEFPEFLDFRDRSRPRGDGEGSDKTPDHGETTPEEALESAYQSLRKNIEAELLDTVKSASPEFFERLVVELLVAMGYGGSRQDAGSAIGRSGDGGIDGMIKEDRLGLDVIFLQAKRWENVVGRPDVQKFAGALQGRRAKKGVFITTSAFSKEAGEYADDIDSKIVLIDGAELARLMFDHDVGVTSVGQYESKEVDSDYFEEG